MIPKNVMTDLRFDNIFYTYPGIGTPALDGISLDVGLGKRIALIGRNGGGKSTLMMIAGGLIRPNRGKLLIDGSPVEYDKKKIHRLRERVGIVFQNPEDQLFSADVYQDISAGPLNLGLSAAETRARVEDVAERCGLTALLDRPTHALSGGEKTRAALAGILAMHPDFLFADEITNALDPWIRLQVLDILDRWTAENHTVILATHDWELAKNWAEEIVWIEKGKIFRRGEPGEIFRNGTAPERY